MKLGEVLETISNDYPAIEADTFSANKFVLSASFVIPTYNSADSLWLVLSAIDNQLMAGAIAEVVIIDDGSEDETESLVKRAQSQLRVKIVYKKSDAGNNRAVARNMGIFLATGDIICFIDSDIIIPPDYLNHHLAIHEKIPNAITISMRSFVTKDGFQFLSSPFPVKSYVNEFRIEKYIDPERCDTDDKRILAGKTVHLFADSDKFKNLGYGRRIYWSLPEICLTCAICYKRLDLLKVKGAPTNFIGWGFNDISMAAKVISLDRFVIPVMDSGVYHINHIARSKNNKYDEFKINQSRYRKMLQMEQADTFKERVKELD